MDQLSENRLVVRLKETESTNVYLKDLLKTQPLEEGSMVITDFQTAGRGQLGYGWFSSAGKNLLCSFLVLPRQVKVKDQFIISRIASLAIKNTLDQITNDIRIKWPNDIYWQDKKIAGILIENMIQDDHIDSTIIGIGLNINEDEFPENIPNPVSLKQITKTDYDRNTILKEILKEFFILYREVQQGSTQAIEDEYMLDLYRANDYYMFEDANGQFKAKIDNVMPSGHIVLRTLDNDEQRTYAFKEVAFVN